MTYRITENINLPFKIMPVYSELGKNKLEIRIKIKSIFEKNLFATNLAIKIPVPKNTANVNSNSAIGKAKHEPE